MTSKDVGQTRPSDAEERLHLVPRGQDHERRQEREGEQGDPEADVRAPGLAAAFNARATAGPLAAVGTLDCERVE